MLIESPDKLIINGRKLSWIDGTTFFAFKTPQGKIHLAITSGSGTEFLLQINEIDLTQYVKKNIPEAVVYLDHESLANVLHQIKPEMIKAKMNREEFEFSGRLWNGNGINYISFWNNKKSVDKALLDKLLKYLKVDYSNTVFEFPNNQGDYKPYDKIVDGTSVGDKSAKFMSQLHTLPPGAKKWAMRGLSMREALFTESPDNVYVKSDIISYDSEYPTSVFSIFDDIIDKRVNIIVALCENGQIKKLTTGDNRLDNEINVKDHLESLTGKVITHEKILSCVTDRLDEGEPYRILRDGTLISGRSFLLGETTYVSFWNEVDVVVKHKKYIDKILNMLNVPYKSIRFETIDFQEEFPSYEELFGEAPSDRKPSSLSPEQIKQLMKRQHIDPRAKQILYKFASSDKYLDSLKLTASKMNISVAQLKHLMTVGD